MSYVSPETVLSPRGLVEDVDVVYNKGPLDDSWSVARLKWAGRDAVGIRWNGNASDSGIGSPQSRGIATWFIIPEAIADLVVGAVEALAKDKDAALLEGYHGMVADREREDEAAAWSEAMIGDGFEAR